MRCDHATKRDSHILRVKVVLSILFFILSPIMYVLVVDLTFDAVHTRGVFGIHLVTTPIIDQLWP